MTAILLRGLGLGFLFLSITLIAFSNLNDGNRAAGIGLFNAVRQFGGLMGVAGLQTLIDHNVTTNLAVLGAHVTAGVPAVSERLAATTAMLAATGMDAVAAGRAATSLLGRAVTGQATVIAFDTAFNAVALIFVVAAPILITIKIGFSLYAKITPRGQAWPLTSNSCRLPPDRTMLYRGRTRARTSCWRSARYLPVRATQLPISAAFCIVADIRRTISGQRSVVLMIL